MTSLLQDLRYAGRMLMSRPGISVLAILSLALGIGVNTSIFGVINAVLLRDLAVEAPQDLADVYTNDDTLGHAPSSYPDYVDFRDGATVFTDMLAHAGTFVAWDSGDGTDLLLGEIVSGNYFDLLGLEASHGRTLRAETDDRVGAEPVVVLGHGLFRRRFGADPSVLGETLRLNGNLFTVVGVAPPAFKGLTQALEAELFIPVAQKDLVDEGKVLLEDRRRRWLWVKGRLTKESTFEQAETEIATIARRLEVAYPETNKDRVTMVLPSASVAIHPAFDGALFGIAGLLMAVVGMVLLIACANNANLLLARASERRREIAIRLALGSGRARLIRQLLTESSLMALLGGGLGVAIAYASTDFLVRFKPPLGVPVSLNLGLDQQVLVFALAISLVTGLLCGLAPALQASRPNLVPALKNDAQALGHSFRRLGLRNVLVVTQVAGSTLLLIAAGLFLRSLMNAGAIDPGFSLRQGAMAQIGLGFGDYTEEEGRMFYDQALERVRALPGIDGAALASHLPLGAEIHVDSVFVEGQSQTPSEDGVEVDTTSVGPEYFTTLGISLTQGRRFSRQDQAEAPPVVIVNQTLARRFWPGENPLGKRLSIDGAEGPYAEVVGVAEDGKYRTLGEAQRGYLYLPILQRYQSRHAILARSTRSDRELVKRLRAELLDLDPNLTLFEVKTIGDHLSIMLFPPRMGAVLLAAMGGLGLVLAAVGIYSIVAYAVTRRSREVGIRMALGARGRDVLQLVLAEGMTLVIIGLGLGLAAALAATRLLASWLYGIAPSDPLTYVAVPLLLGLVGLAANLIPARRATRVDPVETLRAE